MRSQGNSGEALLHIGYLASNEMRPGVQSSTNAPVIETISCGISHQLMIVKGT